jgi:hypothetical protein
VSDPQKPKKKSSTSADIPRVSADVLGRSFIGTEVTVLGRDVTLGENKAVPILHRGIVESLHINQRRVRLVMKRHMRASISQSRVIEVTE